MDLASSVNLCCDRQESQAKRELRVPREKKPVYMSEIACGDRTREICCQYYAVHDIKTRYTAELDCLLRYVRLGRGPNGIMTASQDI